MSQVEVTTESKQDVSTVKAGLFAEFSERGVRTERAITLKDGGKGSNTDHTHPRNQHDPEELGGNYGILAGWGLLIFDLDHYEDDIPMSLIDLFNDHPTIRVDTPHMGDHLYYLAPDDAAERIEEVAGLPNPTYGGIEVKSKNSLVVGPGSEIESCTKCDSCHIPGEGQYEVGHWDSIPELDFERFLTILEELEEERSTEQDTSAEAGTIQLEADVEDWIENGRESDEYLNQLIECLGSSSFEPGDYPLITHEDRSRVETALAEKLFWRFGAFEHHEETVRTIMTQLHPPKWSNRGEEYRDSVIQSARNYTTGVGEFYEVSEGRQKEGSVLQRHADRIVLIAKYNVEETFTTPEVASLIDEIGVRQARKVLNALKDAGYLSKTFVKDNEHFKKVAEIDTTGKAYDLFLDQYRTLEEVKEIQHDYLSDDDPDPEPGITVESI